MSLFLLRPQFTLPALRLILVVLSMASVSLPALAADTAADDPNANATFDVNGQITPVDCEGLAEAAGRKVGLPDGLLASIARMESGRRTEDGSVHAWPWTLDEAGKGSFYADKASAMAHLQAAVDGGATNVDVGCMQLNYKWHARAFPDLETMMDPVANTEYAARFLKALIDKLGDVNLAIGVYHSLDPAKGAPYQKRVSEIWAALGPITPLDPSLLTGSPDAYASLAPDPGVLQGIMMVAAGPLFAESGASLLVTPDLQAQADGTQPNADLLADPNADPAFLPVDAPVADPAATLTLALPSKYKADKSVALLAEADANSALAAQWSDVESLRAVLAP